MKENNQAPSYSDWLAALQQATTFDLYRLYELIGDELNNPKRVMAIHQALQVGQKLHYFDPSTKTQHPCQIISLGRKRVRARDLDNGRIYSLAHYMLNLEGKAVDVEQPVQHGLSRHSLKVGELVGFNDKQGCPIQGRILRLNDKTVTLACPDGQWRVAYEWLYTVLEAHAEPSRDTKRLE